LIYFNGENIGLFCHTTEFAKIYTKTYLEPSGHKNDLQHLLMPQHFTLSSYLTSD